MLKSPLAGGESPVVVAGAGLAIATSDVSVLGYSIGSNVIGIIVTAGLGGALTGGLRSRLR